MLEEQFNIEGMKVGQASAAFKVRGKRLEFNQNDLILSSKEPIDFSFNKNADTCQFCNSVFTKKKQPVNWYGILNNI